MMNDFLTGCIVELLEMNDTQAPPVGTLGVVTMQDDMKQIHVAWETGSSLALIPQTDKYHFIASNDGFTEDTLFRYAYGKYVTEWRKRNGIGEEEIRKTYDAWKEYLSDGIMEPLIFNDYIQVFGWVCPGGEKVQISGDEFREKVFNDKGQMKKFLGKLAFEAWERIIMNPGKEHSCNSHKKCQLNKKEPQGMIELHLDECKQNNQNTGGKPSRCYSMTIPPASENGSEKLYTLR